jgi:hypothetical protein
MEDVYGRNWRMEKRQSLDEDDFKNLNMFDVNVLGGVDRDQWLNSFKCCSMEATQIGFGEDRKRVIRKMSVNKGSLV